MKRRNFIFIILLLSYYEISFAQEYLFRVPKVEMDVQLQSSAAAVVFYRMEFENTPGGHPIDIVDIGLPHENYDVSNIKAWVNGQEVSGPIFASQYVKPGVEVHLGNVTIPPGSSGTFEFEASIPDLVFQDTTHKDLASFQISPTWFGDQYVEGPTNLSIRVFLPNGLKPDEVLFQDRPFQQNELQQDGRILIAWQVQRRFTGPYRVGVSFPKRVMQNVVSMSIPKLLMRWWRATFSEKTRMWISLAAAVLLFIIYMRFTGGTGCVFFVPVLIACAIFYWKVDIAEILIWPLLLILAVIVETARKKRKSRYLPAIASVEGGGIKRGLTAPEAAVLLELPMNQVVTLVLYGMLKKGFIQQTGKTPVRFIVEEKPPAEAILHNYEKQFLKKLQENKKAESISAIDFTKPVKSLIDSVAARVVGHDLDETRGYYKSIISRAWKEAQEMGDVETWQKKMDEKVDWMMLDPDFQGRFRPYQDRYIPRPYRTTSLPLPGGATAAPKSPSSVNTTSFRDVAGSVSGWFQATAAGVAGSIEGQKGGILNFGSIDKAIGKAMASSGGGGSSGSGGGCACACAGCACACACAGGGR